MHLRGAPRPASGRPAARPGYLAAAALLMTLAAGCGPAAQQHPGAGATPLSCGAARTAANVPVNVEVTKGSVSCPTAMRVERDYARAIRSGRAPGNGGGGPVKVKGWTCQGFATPVVLRTGKASKCVRDGDEILELLPPQ